MDTHPLTIQTPDGQIRTFDAQELSDRHKDLCKVNAERLMVVNSKTLKQDDKNPFIIELSTSDKVQLIKALLSSNAQDPASPEGCYVVDVANLEPLPQPVHDILYGKTVTPLLQSEEEGDKDTKEDAPCTQKLTLLQTVFNKTTLSCAACIVGTYLITTRLHASDN